MFILSAAQMFWRPLCGGLVVVTLGSAVSAAPTIQWRVDNPFRFFRYESDFEIHRWAYGQLSDQDKQDHPASATERKLNNPRWWRTAGPEGKTYLELLASLRRTERRGVTEHDPRLGWASLLREDTNDTCWSEATQLYRDCDSSAVKVTPQSSYLDPAAHKVTAWLSDGSSTATCQWTADSPVFIDQNQTAATPSANLTARCDMRVSLLIPNEKSTPVTVRGDPAGDARRNFLSKASSLLDLEIPWLLARETQTFQLNSIRRRA